MKSKISLIVSIVLIFISSFSIVLIPLSDFNGNTKQKILAYFIGILFWTCLIAAWIIHAVIYKSAKHIKKRIGIISLFENSPAKIFDVLTLLSLIEVIAVTIISAKGSVPEAVSYISVSVLLFVFQMHCIFNGKNFKYVMSSN